MELQNIFIDTKQAYSYAPAKRNAYMKVTMEDFEEGMCGKLRKSMYGTRDASLNSEEKEEEYVRFMVSVGLSGDFPVHACFITRERLYMR